MPDTATSDTPVVGTLLDGLTDVLPHMRHENFWPSIPTGAPYLDRLLAGGLHPGQLAVAASVDPCLLRALMLTWCHHAAVERGIPTMMFTVPTTAGHSRAAAMSTALTIIECGPNWREHRPDAYFGFEHLGRAPLWINGAARTMNTVAAGARTASERHGIRLLIVDGIANLIDDDTPAATTAGVISHATVVLKALARQLSAAVLVTSSARTAPKSRTDLHLPQLVDLVGSGSLENDADLVVFVHPDGPNNDAVRLTVAKHRNGPRASYPARYDAARGILTASP
jgi:replicative DNA helicase